MALANSTGVQRFCMGMEIPREVIASNRYRFYANARARFTMLTFEPL